MASLRVALIVFGLLFAVGVAGELVFKKRKLDGGNKQRRVAQKDGQLRMLFYKVLIQDTPFSPLQAVENDVDVVVLTGIKTAVTEPAKLLPLKVVCGSKEQSTDERNIVLSLPSVFVECS